MVQSKKLDEWWQDANFTSWFLNDEEFRERLEYICDVALDHFATMVSLMPEMNAGDALKTAKLAFELADKMPKKKMEHTVSDNKIAQMNEAELREYVKLNAPRVVELTEGKSEE